MKRPSCDGIAEHFFMHAGKNDARRNFLLCVSLPTVLSIDLLANGKLLVQGWSGTNFSTRIGVYIFTLD
jgi:hypothetical protein